MHYDEISGLVDYATREQVIDYAASKAENGMIFVELGCYLGSTLCRLAAKIKERGIKCKIIGIDNWNCVNISHDSLKYSKLKEYSEVYTTFLSNVTSCGLDDMITHIVADTEKAAINFEDNSVDYIFFDANHGFGGIREELLAWMPKLKEKSLAAIHDWPTPDICNTVREILGNNQIVTGDGNSAWIRKTL